MTETWINGRWSLDLPGHRAVRPEWPYWEAARLAAEHHVVSNLASESDDRGWPVVYCVGAEEGDFPALYALWGADVVLFEPNPRVWPNIRWIFEANHFTGRVRGTFVGFAAAADAIVAPVPPPVEGTVWPHCAFGPVIGDHGFCNIFERPDIDRTRIDTMVANGTPPPSVITIDVEGAELEVLRGAAGVLAAHRPVVFVSVHPQFMVDGYGYPPAALFGYMRDAGYHGRWLATDHEEHWMLWPAERPTVPGLDTDERFLRGDL